MKFLKVDITMPTEASSDENVKTFQEKCKACLGLNESFLRDAHVAFFNGKTTPEGMTMKAEKEQTTSDRGRMDIRFSDVISRFFSVSRFIDAGQLDGIDQPKGVAEIKTAKELKLLSRNIGKHLDQPCRYSKEFLHKVVTADFIAMVVSNGHSCILGFMNWNGFASLDVVFYNKVLDLSKYASFSARRF